MSFAGLSLLQLAPIFFVGAGLLSALYLLRMRRRKIEVPFAELWKQVARSSQSQKIWKRFRRIFSWALQILIFALILLALADPRTEAWFRESRTLAIVLDASSSMAAPHVAAPEIRSNQSRLEAAKDRVRSEISALGPRDRLLLIVAGHETLVPIPLSDSPQQLNSRIDAIHIQEGEANFDQAIDLARHALTGLPKAEILILSDGALDQTSLGAVNDCLQRSSDGLSCHTWMLGSPMAENPSNDNVAIVAFAARRYPHNRERVEALLNIKNFSAAPAEFELEILADGLPIGARQQLKLSGGEMSRQVLQDLDASRPQLEARITPLTTDSGTSLGLPLDDRAWAIIPPVDPMEVTLVSDGGDLFLDAALLSLDDHIRLSGVDIDKVDEHREELDSADLVVFDIADKPLPKELPNTNLLIFDPLRLQDSPIPLRKYHDIRRPRITQQTRKQPMLEGVVFKDVNIARGTSFVLDEKSTALASHLGEALIVLREGKHSQVFVGFDPRQSDLPLRSAFPTFVANVIDAIGKRDASFLASVALGSTQDIVLANIGLDLGDDHGVTKVQVTPPGAQKSGRGASVELAENGVLRFKARQSGIYTLKTKDPPGEAQLAVIQGDPQASDPRQRLQVEEAQQAKETPASVSLEEHPLWMLLLLITGTLLLTEWGSYQRRKTV